MHPFPLVGQGTHRSTPPARGATLRPDGATEGGGDFNPRPPRGGRLHKLEIRRMRKQFQSAPPARGATALLRHRDAVFRISIRAPREGGDWEDVCHYKGATRFQSAPPVRGAT